MRKSFLLLLVLICTSCGCMLSQIPPQKVYATPTTCTATLPDYRLKITATDNCEIASMTQVPAPGFLLTPTNKTTTVTVKATDGSGNFVQVVFTVTLLDTIKPKLTIDPTLLSYEMNQIKDLYNFADRVIERHLAMMDKQIADTNVFPESQFPNLRNVYEDSTYYKQKMITWVSPGHAVTGYGSRWWTFMRPNDTILIVPKNIPLTLNY